MGKESANRKAPSELLSSMPQIGTKSPLMNWAEMKRQPETASTGRSRMKFPPLAERILVIPLRGLFCFMEIHARAIGATIVVVVTLGLLFVFWQDGTANMQRDKSEIQFDDVTVHPLYNRGSAASGWSGGDDNSFLNSSRIDTSVSVAESHTEISPIQPEKFTKQNISEAKQGAWLTGTIEFGQTRLSHSLPSSNRIGQRIE